MDILASMKVFVAVVEADSFAGAAARLNMSRAMASKHVLLLEDHLGIVEDLRHRNLSHRLVLVVKCESNTWRRYLGPGQ